MSLVVSALLAMTSGAFAAPAQDAPADGEPRAAAASSAIEPIAFADDFESETAGGQPENWDADRNGVAEVKVSEEGGNRFLKVEKKEQGVGETANIPVVATRDGAVDLPMRVPGQKLVVEVSFRIHSPEVYRSVLRLGFPKNEDGLFYDDVGQNRYALMYTHTNGDFYFLKGLASTGAPNFANLAGKKAEAGTWYRYKAVIDTNMQKIDHYLDDEAVFLQQDFINKEFEAMESVTNLSFTWREKATKAAGIIDYDDVRLYYVNSAPQAELLTDAEGKIPANAEIGIRFSGRMDAQSLTDQTVILYDGSEEIVCTARRYDSESMTYYLTPDAQLEGGKSYTVQLSDEIYAENLPEFQEEGKFGGESLVFEAGVVKSADASLASITVDGAPLGGFSPEIFSYVYSIPYAEDMPMPVVKAVTSDPGARAEVTYPAEVKGDIVVDVMAEDGINKKQYRITLDVVGEELANLGKNLLKDPGFESGTVADYYTSPPGKWNGFGATQEQVHSGEYAALAQGRTDLQWLFKQDVPVKGNKTFLLSGWVRIKDAQYENTAFEFFPGEPSTSYNRPDRDNERLSVKADEWKHIIMTVETIKDMNLSPSLVCWKAGVDYYVDDLYAGELKPTLSYTGPAQVTAPQPGQPDAVAALTLDIVNQFGTKNGLKNETVDEWRVISAPYGVSVGGKDGSELIISSDADRGTVELEAVVHPKYVGAYTDELTQRVAVEVLPNGDKSPQVKEIKLSGEVDAGNTLSVSYRYYQQDGEPQGDTQIQWVYSDQMEDGYQPIPGATGSNYVVSQEYADYFIRVQITPKNQDGAAGKTVLSPGYLVKSARPAAEDVEISGLSAIGETLTGSYRFSDRNGDAEGETTFRWLRASSKDGEYVPIAGATGKSYTLTKDDTDCFLRFAVTPVAQNEPFDGEEALSASVSGPRKPTVENVKIVKVSDKLLRASYDYVHPNQGIAQGETICKWYVDDSLAETGTSYTVNFSGKKTVRLEVTPVAVKAPEQGEPVSVSITVGKKESSGGGGGGSIGGGNSVSSGAPGIVPLPSPTPAPEKPAGHWADEAIAFVRESGIMENAAADDFKPDELVSRADFITYIMKTLELAPTDYQGGFADVAQEDSYSGLLQAAVEHGIISRDERFYPQRSVSREEICKILTAGTAAALPSLEMKTADLTGYADAGQIAEWAVQYVERAVGLGLLQGVSKTEFLPKGNVTRAQTATILQRLSQYLDSRKEGVES